MIAMFAYLSAAILVSMLLHSSHTTDISDDTLSILPHDIYLQPDQHRPLVLSVDYVGRWRGYPFLFCRYSFCDCPLISVNGKDNHVHGLDIVSLLSLAAIKNNPVNKKQKHSHLLMVQLWIWGIDTLGSHHCHHCNCLSG